MAYDTHLAERLRTFLEPYALDITEKKMFGGLAFMVNDKMCINVSKDRLMCRYDPALSEEVSLRPGYEQMIMKGREMNGYCYVHPEGFVSEEDLRYWVELCIEFNDRAKSSKRK